MGLRTWWEGLWTPPALTPPGPAIVEGAETERAAITEARKGYDVAHAGVSPLLGGVRVGGGDRTSWEDRQRVLPMLYGAYLANPWVSTCIDRIAGSVTAGGLELVALHPDVDGEPEEPAALAPVRALLDNPNSGDDETTDLTKGWIANAHIFGAGYLEVVYLGKTPAALYPLNSCTIRIDRDSQGEETGYTQVVHDGRPAVHFDRHEIIKLVLRDPNGSPYGLGLVEKLLDPITRWIYYAAWEQHYVRAGLPPDLHVDLGQMPETDRRRWPEQDRTSRRGIANIGEPLVTWNGGSVNPLPRPTLEMALEGKKVARDEIVSGSGVPPSKVGIIESGNLGGGTGEAQDKTFRVDVTEPVGRLSLEPLVDRLIRQPTKVTDWGLRWGTVDTRDSKVIEEVRDARLRSGRDTLNEQRAAEGKPPVEGGDTPIFAVAAGSAIPWETMDSKGTTPPQLAPFTGQQPGRGGDQDDQAPSEPPSDGDEPAQESARDRAVVREAVGADLGGVMVALYPDPLIARGLAVPDGEPPERLHLTLAYLGKAAELDADASTRLQQVVVGFAATARPVDATLGSTGLFVGGGTPVTVALVDAPSLPSMRQRLVDLLDRAGLPVRRDHGYTPHITLAYDDRLVSVPATEITFRAISVVVGGDRVDIPLSGVMSESEQRSGVPDATRQPLETSWRKAFEHRRRRVLRELPKEPVHAGK